jgi:hypothetical protein
LTKKPLYDKVVIEREVNSMWIWFDMDGTIADLYGVDGWLDDLMAHNVRPYAEARPLYAEIDLLMLFADLKMRGYNLGVISWGSKERNADYDKAVAKVKRRWLWERCLSDLLDEIIVTPYGVRKADTCRRYGTGILVDDEEQNRTAWDLGATVDATDNIIDALRAVI